ncbi:MAG: hypothetical protein SGJ07_15055 [Rhodospirillaceae bacterium]|nr:hypothetical protein [Rhodospirillaceae bacterium]
MKQRLIRTIFLAALLPSAALFGGALTSAAVRAQEATPPPAIPVEPVDALPLEPLPPRHFTGVPVVIDAVTLQLEGEHFKLYGLRSFPGDWRADAIARVALELVLSEAELDCYSAGHDRFRRSLVSCSIGADDLVETMLEAGMGIVDRQTTRAPSADPALADRYDEAERAAREHSAGLWATVPGFEPPPSELPPPPEPGLMDWIERFQAGLAVLIGMIGIAIALVVSRRPHGPVVRR